MSETHAATERADPAARDATALRDVPVASNPQQNNGVAIYKRIGDPMDFINKMGRDLYESKMFGLSNVAQGRALMLMFMLKGVDPFDFKRRNHIIGGDVSMRSAAMLSDHHTLVGGDHTIIERTPERAAIELTRGRKKYTFAFTWEEAKKEDYVWTKDAAFGKVAKHLPNGDVNPAALKDNWCTPRRRMQMLWQRVVSDGVKAVSPEVNHGLYTPEELGANVDDEIVDAEYEVRSTADAKAETPAAATEAATDDAQGDAKEEAQAEEPADSAATTEAPASDAAAPETETAQASTGAESASPAQQMLADAEQGVDEEALRVELLREVTKFKRDLNTTSDKWKAYLKKNFGTESAKELSRERLTELVMRLSVLIDKRNKANQANQAGQDKQEGQEPTTGGTSAVDTWANGGGGQPLKAPAGNE